VSDKESIGLGIEVDGIRETLKALRKLDKDAQKEGREKALEIANILADRIRERLNSDPDPRYRALAVSVKAGRDRVPVVRVGGRASPKVSGGGGPRELVIGMEFGANQNGPNAWRFPPRTPKLGRGNQGYYIYPALKANQDEIIRLWFDAMDKLLNDWAD
jgi:hypothetical protein